MNPEAEQDDRSIRLESWVYLTDDAPMSFELDFTVARLVFGAPWETLHVTCTLGALEALARLIEEARSALDVPPRNEK
ncbi:hypothetical protein Acsp05_45500 [Actinokineospora sp. NBRC 105648]|nr:hypothetical protein Acsp05_45500 [Actinokineospora sp. NBRC 105648]